MWFYRTPDYRGTAKCLDNAKHGLATLSVQALPTGLPVHPLLDLPTPEPMDPPLILPSVASPESAPVEKEQFNDTLEPVSTSQEEPLLVS